MNIARAVLHRLVLCLFLRLSPVSRFRPLQPRPECVARLDGADVRRVRA